MVAVNTDRVVLRLPGQTPHGGGVGIIANSGNCQRLCGCLLLLTWGWIVTLLDVNRQEWERRKMRDAAPE